MKAYSASHEELCDQALQHYERLAKECSSWNSVIPKAIAFYRANGRKVKEIEGDQIEKGKTCY